MRLLDVPSSYCGATKIFVKWHKNTTNYRNIKKVNLEIYFFDISVVCGKLVVCEISSLWNW